MASNDERFDGVLLGLAQNISRAHGPGVENILDTFLGFLRRKTDFFHGAASQASIEAVMKSALGRQLKIAAAEREKIEAQKRKEKKKEAEAKARLEAKRAKRAAEDAQKAKAKGKGKVKVKDVEIEMLDDDVDIDAAKKAAERANQASVAEAVSREGSTKDEDGEAGEEAEKGLKPNAGNGFDHDDYSWQQTLQEVNVSVPLPSGIKARSIVCDFTRSKLKLGIKGEEPILEGELFNEIVVDECTWTLEDASDGGRTLGLYLHKRNSMEWWKCIVKGEEEINTQKVVPENSKLSDLDGDTRQTVEKMMYDQKQKALGLPTADEQHKQNMIKKFMDQHPEMDFSNAKIS